MSTYSNNPQCQLTIILKGRDGLPIIPNCRHERFCTEFTALAIKWGLSISSHKMYIGPIVQIANPLTISAIPNLILQPRRSKRLASQAKPNYI